MQVTVRLSIPYRPPCDELCALVARVRVRVSGLDVWCGVVPIPTRIRLAIGHVATIPPVAPLTVSLPSQSAGEVFLKVPSAGSFSIRVGSGIADVTVQAAVVAARRLAPMLANGGEISRLGAASWHWVVGALTAAVVRWDGPPPAVGKRSAVVAWIAVCCVVLVLPRSWSKSALWPICAEARVGHVVV